VPNFFVAARNRERKNGSFIVIIIIPIVYVENMNQVTDWKELEILAEFYIFSPGERHLAATKTSGQSNSILVGCRFKNEKSFSDSNDESRLFYLLSKTFSVK
jgi:hypothetical protein